ncbi:CocE/NonD family hydrolase [Nocardia panacis]|uniref:CocE/NonD family hydrolase n=1 Tax=Nocardia panacis TaxID=2340916 RepID=A0A3A4JW93_9NOCA|nr:CocE/NonD family hydrolase [Nocardia panacis]RJO68192.1 CocE/NonD family hydrolase [Nocardia panacis]
MIGSARCLLTALGCVGILVAGCSSGEARQPAPPGAWPPDTDRGDCAVQTQRDVPAAMRDGTVLRADVYRPRSEQPVPVLLMRTQYGKAAAQIQPSRYRTPEWFASHCYLVVVQDVRGLGSSDGVFTEFGNDQHDGYDTVEWAAQLPGANGEVGMYGSSYVGATQWLAATETPPHLRTIVPANTAADYYDGWTYEGGAFRLGFVEPWAMGTIGAEAAQRRGDKATVDELKAAVADTTQWLNYRPYQRFPPLRPDDPEVAPWFFDWIRNPTRTDYWQRWSIRDRYANVQVPVLDIEGWYDAFLAGGVQNFAGMVDRGGSPLAKRNQRLVIGPWDHLGWGRTTSTIAPRLERLGPVADSPINELMLTWFDHFLKGKDNGVAGEPRVDYYLMGANRWKSAPSWPLPRTEWTEYFFTGNGGNGPQGRVGALSAQPNGNGSDRYVYDPATPAPSVGGHSCCGVGSGPQGPFDQTSVEQRSDVLTYTGAPLAADTEVTGPVTVQLWAASTAPDTDFVARLEVVAPDGSAVNLNNGIVRAALRDSLDTPAPLQPGKPYLFTIEIWPTSYQFRAGDRIRVAVSSSDYPQYAPNPNTGEPFGASARTQPATQTIYHDVAHPSSVVLPVIPPGDSGSDRFPLSPGGR